MKETVARLAPKYSSTGSMKTGKPLLTAVLLIEETNAPRVTIHQPKKNLGRCGARTGIFKPVSKTGRLIL
jgi:hypothetical protein